MKILNVVTSLRFGGAERLIEETAPLLKSRGCFLDVCIFDGGETPLKRSLTDKGINIISFGKKKNIYRPSIFFKLLKLMRKYDIVHTHNTSPQFFAALAGLFCRCKLITTEHSTSNRRRNYWLFEILDKWMYEQYDRIVCISDATKESLTEYIGSVKTKAIVINNGIDVQKFKSAVPLSLSEVNTKKFVVTMVSGFRYQKDHDTLLRAMSYLNKDKYEIWLVGEGDRRSVIVDLIRELNLSQNVRLWGSSDDIPSIMKSSDVIVQSSHIEGFGLTAVEGMAAGKPVIASNVPGLSQVVYGAGFLFPEGDAKALASLIEMLSENRYIYDRVSFDCLKRAELYDISIMVDKLYDLYQAELGVL